MENLIKALQIFMTNVDTKRYNLCEESIVTDLCGETIIKIGNKLVMNGK